MDLHRAFDVVGAKWTDRQKIVYAASESKWVVGKEAASVHPQFFTGRVQNRKAFQQWFDRPLIGFFVEVAEHDIYSPIGILDDLLCSTRFSGADVSGSVLHPGVISLRL